MNAPRIYIKFVTYFADSVRTLVLHYIPALHQYVPSVLYEVCLSFVLSRSPVFFSVSPLLFRPLKLNSLNLEGRFKFTLLFLYKAHSWPWHSASRSPT